MNSEGPNGRPTQPVPELILSPVDPDRPPVRRVASVRVPLTLTICPWATLYEFPDGRLLWCLRLPGVSGVRTRCIGSEALRRYARESGLTRLERGVSRALAKARGGP
jgi:hypothetical protein